MKDGGTRLRCHTADCDLLSGLDISRCYSGHGKISLCESWICTSKVSVAVVPLKHTIDVDSERNGG